MGGQIVNAWKHFKTITYHKYLVGKGCFRVGLYRQGLFHDLSKYSPSEFLAGIKYYQGTRSPNNAERENKGYSAAWMHHKGRNRHHFEYWNDYSATDNPGTIVPVPMPDRYIAEMIMDRIAACKVYEGKNYTDASPYAYYQKGSFRAPMHEETRRKLERMLRLLATEGEEKTFTRIEREMVRRKPKKRVNKREDERVKKIDRQREQICKMREDEGKELIQNK